MKLAGEPLCFNIAEIQASHIRKESDLLLAVSRAGIGNQRVPFSHSRET